MKQKITIDGYLQKLARFAGSDYGKMVRTQFADINGGSELAMLAAPSAEELGQLERAVAIMTSAEKENAADLPDDRIQRIAADAHIDPAIFAIFINGFALHIRKNK